MIDDEIALGELGEEIVKTTEEGEKNLAEIEDEILESDGPVAP